MATDAIPMKIPEIPLHDLEVAQSFWANPLADERFPPGMRDNILLNKAMEEIRDDLLRFFYQQIQLKKQIGFRDRFTASGHRKKESIGALIITNRDALAERALTRLRQDDYGFSTDEKARLLKGRADADPASFKGLAPEEALKLFGINIRNTNCAFGGENKGASFDLEITIPRPVQGEHTEALANASEPAEKKPPGTVGDRQTTISAAR